MAFIVLFLSPWRLFLIMWTLNTPLMLALFKNCQLCLWRLGDEDCWILFLLLLLSFFFSFQEEVSFSLKRWHLGWNFVSYFFFFFKWLKINTVLQFLQKEGQKLVWKTVFITDCHHSSADPPSSMGTGLPLAFSSLKNLHCFYQLLINAMLMQYFFLMHRLLISALNLTGFNLLSAVVFSASYLFYFVLEFIGTSQNSSQ